MTIFMTSKPKRCLLWAFSSVCSGMSSTHNRRLRCQLGSSPPVLLLFLSTPNLFPSFVPVFFCASSSWLAFYVRSAEFEFLICFHLGLFGMLGEGDRHFLCSSYTFQSSCFPASSLVRRPPPPSPLSLLLLSTYFARTECITLLVFL